VKIEVVFFGALKKYDPHTEWMDVETIEDVILRVPGLEIKPMNFIVSRNGEACEIQTRLDEGDKISFYPMIMGG